MNNDSLTDIRSITEDKNKNIWFGSSNGSLFLYKSANDRFDKMRIETSSDSPAIVYGGINHLLVDQLNNLWIGTDSGLVRFNISSGNVKPFFHNPSDPYSLIDNRVSGTF